MAADTPYLSDLTRRFRAARAYRGLELKDAAAELHTSTDTLRRIEQGVKPIPPTYLSWAINEWQTPSWLLPGDETAQGDQGGARRQLADFSQQELDQDAREHPLAQDAGGGNS